MKTDPGKRRQIITVLIILSVAFLGFVLVTLKQGGEHHSLYASPMATAAVGDSLSAAAQPAPGDPVGSGVAAISIFKMILALAVVIIAIYGGIYLLKRLTSRKHSSRSGTSLLEVLETAYIDPKKSLSLVRVANKSVLIGVTDNQISVLTELDPQLTTTALESAAHKAQTESFGQLLRSASSKLNVFGLKKDIQP